MEEIENTELSVWTLEISLGVRNVSFVAMYSALVINDVSACQLIAIEIEEYNPKENSELSIFVATLFSSNFDFIIFGF